MAEQVVTLDEVEDGIAKVTMSDRVSKNTFSDALIRGLGDAFDALQTDQRFRAVILTGYDSYFASGGTQESLLFLSEGKGTFTDIAQGGGRERGIYSLALDCPIPVISAMQGHGIGGGFVMGMYADFVVLSRESIYTTNFMKYGFTPGMGATLVLPQKLGLALAEEMLFMAKNYYGDELQKRGIPFPVLPRAEVPAYALEFARSLAEKPRLSLITLKDHLVSGLRNKLSATIQQELDMHKKTFHQPEVKQRIKSLFGICASQARAAGGPQAPTDPAKKCTAKNRVFEIIVAHAREVIPSLVTHSFTISDALKDLGANSFERSEIAMMTLETLSLRIPLVDLAGANNIEELVDILYAKLQKT